MIDLDVSRLAPPACKIQNLKDTFWAWIRLVTYWYSGKIISFWFKKIKFIRLIELFLHKISSFNPAFLQASPFNPVMKIFLLIPMNPLLNIIIRSVQ